jgi:uncharacterized membrane protein
VAEDYQKVFRGTYRSYENYPKNSNDDIMAGLCYFTWIVGLISLLAIKPLSPYLRFHAVQSIGLFIITMIFSTISSLLLIVFIGLCLLPFALALSIYALVIMIVVLTGHDHRIPYLADYVERTYV